MKKIFNAGISRRKKSGCSNAAACVRQAYFTCRDPRIFQLERERKGFANGA